MQTVSFCTAGSRSTPVGTEKNDGVGPEDVHDASARSVFCALLAAGCRLMHQPYSATAVLLILGIMFLHTRGFVVTNTKQAFSPVKIVSRGLGHSFAVRATSTSLGYKRRAERGISGSSVALPKIVRYTSSPASAQVQAKTSGMSATVDGGDKNMPEDTSLKGKIKALWKNYGIVAIGTYAGIYVSVLSSVFFALEYDVFNAATFGFDPAAAVQKVCDLVEYSTGNKGLPAYIREHPKVGTFAIAWVMTKFTEPVRLAVAITIVPSVARFLRFAPAAAAKE